MDLSTITTDDFKNLFVRDFPYLPLWNSSKIYNKDDVVFYEDTELFYQSLSDNNIKLPTDKGSWNVYPANKFDYISDDDITKAFGEAKINLNPSLFSDDDELKIAFLYLSAHYLVMDLQTAMQGMSSTGNFPVISKSAGSVSENYAVPQKYLNDPYFAYFAKTGYGLKYLSIMLPKLVGNVGIAFGWSRP